MGRAVLISVKPDWCRLIIAGFKTIEVRKSRPKLSVPFKVYIYCTVKGDACLVGRYRPRLGNGKVIGEFVCDSIYTYSTCNIDGTDLSDEDMEEMSCMSKSDLAAYEMSADFKENSVFKVGLFAWHISDLKIYDEPKLLSEFRIEKAPQSWRYVSEGVDNV